MRDRRRRFSILVATDGSPEANAAVAATTVFPWPQRTHVRGVVALRRLRMLRQPQYVVTAFNRAFQKAATNAQRRLGRRWPDARVVIEDKWAMEAILDQARRIDADVIVVGSRPTGMAARLLLGSVSKQIVRRASCSVLVVHRRGRTVTRVVVGVDGSANSHHAGALLARFKPSRRSYATVLRVVEPIRVPAMPLVPNAARALVTRQAAEAHAEVVREAYHDVETVAKTLKESGWVAQPIVRIGYPLPELLREVARTRARLRVVGARGIGEIERLLLGSVAEGALTRCRVPILIVR